MKYAVEMASGSTLYERRCIPNFIKICLNFRKLLGGYTCRHTDSKIIS
jgi:hypothetical protein